MSHKVFTMGSKLCYYSHDYHLNWPWSYTKWQGYSEKASG